MTRAKPQTQAQRQKAHRGRGVAVAVVITNPDALAALAAAREAHGGIKAGIEAALIYWEANHAHSHMA